MALLTLGTAGFMAWHFYHSEAVASSLGFTHIVVLAAIGLDLWDQFRFQQRHGETALLVQLDNVHFSYRLEEELQEAEIDRARAVLAELETGREIRAF